MSYEVGHRHDLDPKLLWLWCRLAAIALIRPLARESSKKKKKKKKKKRRITKCIYLKNKVDGF